MEYFNYDPLFNEALQLISNARSPHSELPSNKDNGMNLVKEHLVFDFISDEEDKYVSLINIAIQSSCGILHDIIPKLYIHYRIPFDSVKLPFDYPMFSGAFLIMKDVRTKSILVFKTLEQSNLWILKKDNLIENEIKKLNEVNDIKYIYLVDDYAYLQAINYNSDSSDPGKDVGFYSIKWFFEEFFGGEEYARFKYSLNQYNTSVKEYLDYSVVRSLTPHALINFKKIIAESLKIKDYSSLLEKKFTRNNRTYYINNYQFSQIKQQFIDRKTHMLMVGSHDFAESIVTAEWLYSSMKKSKAVDLTVIGTGYFKAVEQLLFDIICLPKNEGKMIKKESSSKEPCDSRGRIALTKNHIKDKQIDFSLGSMANFINDNYTLFRQDLINPTKKYICEYTYSYTKLRNGYFHKDNIHDFKVIDNIREATLGIIFLLLGSFEFSEDEISLLGFEQYDPSEFQKLCEYVHFHDNELFIFDDYPNQPEFLISRSDPKERIVDNKYILYSAAYFVPLGEAKKTVHITEKQHPKRIYRGKFIFSSTEDNPVSLDWQKEELVFESGKFVGTPITSNSKFDY